MLALVINPGGGSTKVAVFKNRRQLLSENIEHPVTQLAKYKLVLDQYRLRRDSVADFLKRHEIDPKTLEAIVTRGGPLVALPGGVYRITGRVVNDIRRGRVQTLHPSLLGPLVAYELGEELGIPAYFVDPESTDEFWDVARVTGLKGVERHALSHALSCRTVARMAAAKLGKQYEKCRFVVVHLGTGFTIAAHVNGRQVDATNANDDGPLSPQRSGSLPCSALIKLCFSGRYSESDVLNLIQRRGGLISHFGTDDLRQIEDLAGKGHKEARTVLDAMAYQIAKEVGAYAVACGTSLDAIVITGGLAKSSWLITDLKRRIAILDRKVFVYPGEEEMSELASRLLGVMEGEEKARSYEQETALG